MLESVSIGRLYRNIKTGNVYHVGLIGNLADTDIWMVVYCPAGEDLNVFRPQPLRLIAKHTETEELLIVSVINDKVRIAPALPNCNEPAIAWARPLELFKQKFQKPDDA